MNWKERFIRTVSYPLYEKSRGLTIRSKLHALEAGRNRTPSEIQDLQLRKLRSLITDCGARTPYYREMLERNGLTADSFQSLADLSRLPVLTKSLLRENREVISQPGLFPRTYCHQSSGSTGDPKVLCADTEAESFRMAALFRSRRWWGWDIGSPVLEIWGTYHLQRSLMRNIRMSWIENRFRFSAMRLTDASAAETWKLFRKHRGAYVRGYVSSILGIARLFEESGRHPAELGFRAVCTTSERLYDDQRRFLESAFRCPVIDEYGASEVGIIAFQCPSGGMHLMEENLIAEFADLPQAGPDGPKRLILTELNNRATPLLRYEIGDLVRPDPEPCACGSALSRIRVDIGRDSEMVRLPDGSQVSPVLFCHMGQYSFFEIGRKIRQYRIIQKRLDLFEVEVVCRTEDQADVESYFRKAFEEDFDGLVRLNVRFRDSIPPDASGKHRMFISEIPTGGSESG
ncbi:phenylacetate--CoA ligase family protein [bacterium]|nr:phenylacetate--CoA ligase family protein [bacterium]